MRVTWRGPRDVQTFPPLRHQREDRAAMIARWAPEISSTSDWWSWKLRPAATASRAIRCSRRSIGRMQVRAPPVI